jgi:glycosyltransferase involved in cell wall biosynthesis
MTATRPTHDAHQAQPHLLYVAWGYPPSRGAGMYRALATANAFVRNGWRVTVLTATRDTFERLTGSDPDSEASIDPRVKVVRIPFDPPRGEPDISKWTRSRIYSPLLWNYLRWKWAALKFPEPGYATWLRPLVDAADQIHNADNVDLVLGTSNPNVDFMPGYALHRRYGVPYVMDHRDTWHLNVYSGRPTGGNRSKRLERKLFAQSSEAWFVNAAIRDWHATTYPERSDSFQVVANGYDPDFLDTNRRRLPTQEGLVFGFLGTTYGPMPLRETLEAWKEARASSELVARSALVFRGRLGHFAEPDAETAALLEEYVTDGVRYEGPVSKTNISGVYQSFDALMLILGRSKYVTSGKVFEYAATGLPIVSAHHPETAASEILSGYPQWFPIAEVTVGEIARAIIGAAEAAVQLDMGDFESNQTWARHLARDEQLLPRVAALKMLVSEARE